MLVHFIFLLWPHVEHSLARMMGVYYERTCQLLNFCIRRLRFLSNQNNDFQKGKKRDQFFEIGKRLFEIFFINGSNAISIANIPGNDVPQQSVAARNVSFLQKAANVARRWIRIVERYESRVNSFWPRRLKQKQGSSENSAIARIKTWQIFFWMLRFDGFQILAERLDVRLVQQRKAALSFGRRTERVRFIFWFHLRGCAFAGFCFHGKVEGRVAFHERSCKLSSTLCPFFTE